MATARDAALRAKGTFATRLNRKSPAAEIAGPLPRVEETLRDPARLMAVARMAGGVTTGAEPALDHLMRVVVTLLDAPIAMLSLLHEGHQQVLSSVGLAQPYASTGIVPLSHSLCKFTVAHGKQLIIRDTHRHAWTSEGAAVRELSIGAYIGVPLVDAAGHAYGVLCAALPTAHAWTSRQMQVLRDMGVVADLLHQRSDAYISAHFLDVEARLAHIVGASSDALLPALGEATSVIGAAFHWDICSIWTLDESVRLLRPITVWTRPESGLETAFVERVRTTARPPHEGLAGAVYMARKALWIDDLSTSHRISRSELARTGGLRGAFGFPVTLGGEQVAIAAFLSQEIRPPQPEALRRSPIWGAQIGGIFARERAISAVAQARAQMQAVADVATDAVVMMGADGIIREWSVGAERIFGYSRAEAVGARLANLLVPPHLRAQHLAGMARYLETGQTRILGQRVRVPALTRGGEQVPIEMFVSRVPQAGPALFAAYLRLVADQATSSAL